VKNIFILLLAITGLLSCKTDRKSKIIIPGDKLKEILTDIYTVDGYYMMKYNDLARQHDTASYYTEVFKEYGYTKANFDSTMKYYSTRTKKFEAIYDDVITNLNKLQHQIFMLEQYADTNRNLFKKKEIWNLPKDDAREMVPFKIAIKDTGLYTIILQLKFWNDDQSIDPHLTAYFWYDDGTKKGHIDYFPVIQYHPTKRLVVLNTQKITLHLKGTFIKGWVLNHNNIDQHFKKHVEVKAIIIAKK